MGYEQDDKPKFDVYIGGLFDGDYADFDDALKRADALMHDIGPDDEHGPEDILIQMVISESVYVPNGHVNDEGDEIMHYVHQPTAEWSRITQALKERDELAAELERVKAELEQTYHVLRNLNTVYDDLKSRLPVNRDGDVPDIGDDIWEWFKEHECPGKNTLKKLIKDKDGWAYIDMYGIRRRPKDFHSTAESCRAAHEKGE